MKPLSKSPLFPIPILILTVSFALSVPADSCSQDDLLGLYFDTYASVACAEGVLPYTPLTQYLVLSNPTMTEIHGFECGITVTGLGTDVLFVGHQNACGMIILPFELDQIQVGCATPIPAVEHTVLMSLDWMYLSLMWEMVLFELHGAAMSSLPGDLPIIQVANGELRQVDVDRLQYVDATSAMTGMFDICYPLANDDQTWGGMKALYR